MNIAHFEKKIAPKGSDYYYSLLKLSDTRKQQAIIILSLFDAVFNIPFHVSEDPIAKAKLAWWQQELENTMAGNPTHPITQLAAKLKLDLLPFKAIISAMQNLIDYCRFETFEDLMVFIIQTYGKREMMLAKLMQVDINQQQETIYQAAMVLALTDFTQKLRAHAKRSYFFFPDSEMLQCKITRQDILSFKTTPNIEQLLLLQHEKILKTSNGKLYQPTTNACLLAKQWWRAAKTENYRVLEQQILIPPLRKLLQVAFLLPIQTLITQYRISIKRS